MSEFDDVLMFMGIYDEDVFEIVCNGNIDYETIEAMIKSLS